MKFRSNTTTLSLPSHHFTVGIMPQASLADRFSSFKDYVRKNKRDVAVFLGIIATIVISQSMFWVRPHVGAYASVAALVVLVTLAVRAPRYRMIAISASILPLAMMVNMSLPQSVPFAQSVVFYSVLLLLGLTYRYMFTLEEPVQNTSLGVKGYLFGLPLLLIGGELLGATAFGLLRENYPYGVSSWALVAAGVVVFAFAEEVVFRGLIQQRARYLLHPILAVALSAILYAAMSLSQGSLPAFVFAALAGVLLSVTYHFRKNLLLTTAMNAAAKLLYVALVATYIYR